MAVRLTVSVPPAPVVVVYAVAQVAPSVEVWIWYAFAYAASQRRTTWPTATAEPRSTWIHCGSDGELDQRVPALPSNAEAAGVPAFSLDEAVAGWPRAAVVIPHGGGPALP